MKNCRSWQVLFSYTAVVSSFMHCAWSLHPLCKHTSPSHSQHSSVPPQATRQQSVALCLRRHLPQAYKHIRTVEKANYNTLCISPTCSCIYKSCTSPVCSCMGQSVASCTGQSVASCTGQSVASCTGQSVASCTGQSVASCTGQSVASCRSTQHHIIPKTHPLHVTYHILEMPVENANGNYCR